MRYTALTGIINDILTERGKAMCYVVHPASMEQCVLLDAHTGLHESEAGDIWGCEGGEHIFYAMERQSWPTTNCLICGHLYAVKRRPRARRKP